MATKSNLQKNRAESIKTQIVEALVKEEQEALFIGSGNEYRKIANIRQSYLEALEVVETMVFLNLKQVTCSFDRLGLFRYVKYMYKKNVSENYCNRKILKLMKKDAEHNTELLKTLWYYIKNNCRVGRTAEQLFIHPNTLNYRVKQIVEMTSIDFDDVHERGELYSQLIALKHIPDYYEFYRNQLY